jgi:hypothetical protein
VGCIEARLNREACSGRLIPREWFLGLGLAAGLLFVLLTQMREQIRLARYEPKKQMDNNEIEWVRKTAYMTPGISEFYRLAKVLALNHRPAEAQQELRKVCKVVPAYQCDLLRRVWEQDALKNEEFAAVKWPN